VTARPKWSRSCPVPAPRSKPRDILAGVPGRAVPTGISATIRGPGDWTLDVPGALAASGDDEMPGWFEVSSHDFPLQDRWRAGRTTAGIPGAIPAGTVRHPGRGVPVTYKGA
jgi:hypothetical protein